MKTALRPLFFIFLLFVGLSACGGSDKKETAGGFTEMPNFTPSENDALTGYVANTFKGAGYNISVDPELIDFSADDKSVGMGESVRETFTITNNSGAERTFKLQIYAVSTGFTLLDENKNNLGKWNEIKVASGATKTFYLQFTGALFGSQTSYVTITSDVAGYIRMPARAKVDGAASFKLIPSGYSCSSSSAPALSSLDFMRVASGNRNRQAFKVCNQGGETVKIYSYEITNDDSGLQSRAFEFVGIQDVWEATDRVNSAFSSGITPTTTEAFLEPQAITYNGQISNPAGDYSVSDYVGEDISNRVIPAGSFYWINVDFEPSLEIEAEEGYYYEPVKINAQLVMKTSLGNVSIPLLGATAGREPELEISYSLNFYTTTVEGKATTYTRPIDMNSNGAAILFDTVNVFSDWVAENYQDATITIKNKGTGSNPLKFFGGEIEGYFEYSAGDDGSVPTFPITLYAGQSQNFKIRYQPTPSHSPEVAVWDFGKFNFQSTAPQTGFERSLILVGEQDVGTAVEIKYSGADLLKYDENSGESTGGKAKNFCVFASDAASDKTTLTFTVKNNSKLQTDDGQGNTLRVDWNIKSAEGTNFFDVNASGSLEVGVGSSQTFDAVIDLDPSVTGGTTVRGVLEITTTFNSAVAEAYDIDTRETQLSHTYAIPFQAQASDTGDCVFDSSSLEGQVTLVSDRMTMVFTDVAETVRNLPAFKFHMPLSIEKGHGPDGKRTLVRLAADINYDKTGKASPVKVNRAYFHQASGPTGCAPLPTNPYRREYQAGSWNGSTASCGEVKVNTQKDGEVTVLGDAACMQANGMQDYVDPVTGKTYEVFYVEFTKLDEDCNPLFFGKFSTFALDKTTGETIRDVFKRSEESPNENEAYYEELYGAFRYDTYIEVFQQELNCGGGTTLAQGLHTDPDTIKACYKEMAAATTSNRRYDGFIGECAYFNFNIYTEEELPIDADAESPNYDNWSSWGIFENHVKDGVEQEGLYDFTLYNVRIEVFVLGAADRVSFFSHEGHLLYSDLYVTLTTKPLAKVGDGVDMDDWADMIAVNTRPHLSREKIYLKDGELYSLGSYWTNDGMNSMFSNTLDPFSGTLGEDRGAFTFADSTKERIVHRGYPINTDQNNLLGLSGIAAFVGKGNTAPVFTKADSTTGIGKSLYLFFHGCIVPGTNLPETQGCMNWSTDSGKMFDERGMPEMSSHRPGEQKSVIEKYVEEGILTTNTLEEYESYNCEDTAQEGFGDHNASMACINYLIYGIDRNRQMDYWKPESNFVYPNSQYKLSDEDYIKSINGTDVDLTPYWSDDDESTNVDNRCGIGM